jgi:hypothetical protein
MALASFRAAKSVFGLSNSPVFHHEFSSIFKAIDAVAENERVLKRVQKLLQRH